MLPQQTRLPPSLKKTEAIRFLVFRDVLAVQRYKKWQETIYIEPCIISWESLLRLQLLQDEESCFTVCIKIISNNLDSNNFAMSADPLFYFYFLYRSNIFLDVFYLPCTRLFVGETKVSQRQIFLYGKKEVLIKWVMLPSILNTWMKS